MAINDREPHHAVNSDIPQSSHSRYTRFHRLNEILLGEALHAFQHKMLAVLCKDQLFMCIVGN